MVVIFVNDVVFWLDLGQEAVFTREGFFLVREERDFTSFLGEDSDLANDINMESFRGGFEVGSAENVVLEED